MHKTFANEPITTADVHYKLRGITSSSLMNGGKAQEQIHIIQHAAAAAPFWDQPLPFRLKSGPQYKSSLYQLIP